MSGKGEGGGPVDLTGPGLPLLTWLRRYDAATLRRDAVAGLTVAVLLVPQSMAYALLAGVPPIYGLYASLIPLLVFPIFTTSRHVAVGVIAIDMLIVNAGLEPLALPGSSRFIALAVLLAMMVGILQVVMGLSRLGFVVNLLSRPVMVGFTSGAALLIALSQLPGLTGMGSESATILPSLLWAVGGHIEEIRLAPAATGIGAVALLLALKSWAPKVPGALVAVVLGTVVVVGTGMAGGAVPVVGEVPGGLPPFEAPTIRAADVRSLLPVAATLALIQFVTLISLAKVFAARHRYSVGADRELVALGMANLAGSFFRGLPVSASFSRSALNEQAGATTPMANVIAGAGVGFSLLLLTPVLALVPVPVLAAIIVVAALGLLDVDQLRFLLRAKSVDGRIAVITFTATVIAGILEGILVGVALSVVMLLLRVSRPNTAVLGHLPGTRSFRDVRHHGEAKALEGIMILRIDASFSFMNAEYLKDMILKRIAREDEPVRAIILDASSVNDLDTTAADILLSVKSTLDERGVDLYFGGVKEPVRETLERTGLYEKLGPDVFFLSPHRAVTHVLKGWGESEAYLKSVPGAVPGGAAPDDGDTPEEPLDSG